MLSKDKKHLCDSNLVICGIAFTGRTETVEDYFKDKVKSLTVIAISGCFLWENLSSCRVYESGKLVNEFRAPNLRIKDNKWYRQPLIPLGVLMYFVAISLALRKVRKEYDLYIGISHTFAFWGIILKKFGIVKSVAYYCLDYYIPETKLIFYNLFMRLLNRIDRFNVKRADYLWDISPKIPEYRQKIGKLKASSYKSIVASMGYSRALRKCKDFTQINRWDIGFVGSLTANQGLQLLVESLPGILKELPQVRVKIIGQGPFMPDLKRIVSENDLEGNFNFLGFIKDESEMLDILSGCAIAVAPYSDSIENKNIFCADTGKPKLYAFIGLPIVATKVLAFSEDISRSKAGIGIDYKKEDLKNACVYLLSDEKRLKEFRDNSFRLGEQFVSDNIFDGIIRQMGLEK
jgi:glycosyltransferase involved in cell wall biosynthesis